MRITPIDIAHKAFSKKMMGYDVDQVTEYLQQVAAAMETLIQERNTLREALREKDLSLADYKDRDKVLKDTITTAAHMSDKLRQDTERESKLILADAQQKAEIIQRDAKDSLKRMYNEITDLKRVRMQFEANLKALAQAHLTLLDQGERYMPQVQLPQTSSMSGQLQGHEFNENKSTSISPLSSGV